MSEAALAEASAALARVDKAKEADDRRAEVCGCGHTMAKHEQSGAVWLCIHGHGKCPCREPRSVLKVPNARVFSYKTDESGHAAVKGIGKTVEMGRGSRLDWTATCCDCDREPVTVVAIDGGARNEPRCEVHR